MKKQKDDDEVEEEEDDAEEDDDDDEEDPRKSRDRESKGRIGMMGFQRLGKKKKKLLCPC